MTWNSTVGVDDPRWYSFFYRMLVFQRRFGFVIFERWESSVATPADGNAECMALEDS